MRKFCPIIFFGLLLIFLFFLSLRNYYSFKLFNDFSVYSQTIWQFSRFKLPYYNHLVFGRIFFLGDHFNPSVILIAPFYWFSSNILVLLIEQGIVTFLNCVLIFMIARKKNLGVMTAMILVVAFIIFPGTLQPLIWDWHMESSAAFFLLLFIYCSLYKKSNSVTSFLAIIFLGFKETNALSLFFVCLWLFLESGRKKKQLIYLMIISIFWFIATTKLIIPYFNGHYYPFAADFSLSQATIFTALTSFFKAKFLFISLMFFGFLPIFGGVSLIPVVGDLGPKFFAVNTLFSDYGLITQYHVYLGVFLALASIYAIYNIRTRFKRTKNIEILTAFFLLISSLFSLFFLAKAPVLNVIQKSFWTRSENMTQLFNFIKAIPQKGTVMSQNNLLPYLSTRDESLYFLTPEYEKISPTIIAFDLTPNQSKINYWFSRWEDIESIKDKLSKDAQYRRILLPDPRHFLFIKN